MKPFPSTFVNITGARCDSSNMLALLDRTFIEYGNPRACAPKNCSLPAGMPEVVHPKALPVDLGSYIVAGPGLSFFSGWRVSLGK